MKCQFEPLTKENIIVVQIEHNTTKIIEKCNNESLYIENIFWVDEKGFVWKSNQWIGFDNYAEISIINPTK